MLPLSSALSQNLYDTVVINAPKIIALEPTTIAYEFHTNDSTEKVIRPTITWADGTDYKVLSGPFKSSSNNKGIWNQDTIYTYINAYTYVLQFQKEGTFVLPSMRITTSSGKTIHSEPYEITVMNDSTQKLQQPVLRAEARVSKNQVSVGETIEYEVHLYFNKFFGISIPRSEWQADDTYERTLVPDRLKLDNNEVYNGIPVHDKLALKAVVTPKKAGKIVLLPAKINVRYLEKKTETSKSIFGNFFENTITKDTVLYTSPIELIVEK